MVKVMVVDDHELVRAGISRILEQSDEVRVVGEAATGEDALELAQTCRPDVVMMDINMPGIGGLEATRKLLRAFPHMKVIALTVHAEQPFPTKLLEAGAMGYLNKGCPAGEMFDAIRAVCRGERYVASQIARKLAAEDLAGAHAGPLDKLSQREMQVLLMVIQGQSIQDMSDVLCLSPKTINTYRYRLHEKLGVSNDVELTHLAMRYGLLKDSD